MKTLVDKFSTVAYAFPRAPCGDDDDDDADHHHDILFQILWAGRKMSIDGADGRTLICEGLLYILLRVC